MARAQAEGALMGKSTRVRTLFRSDLHLGTRGCQAAQVLPFLKRYDADNLYL